MGGRGAIRPNHGLLDIYVERASNENTPFLCGGLQPAALPGQQNEYLARAEKLKPRLVVVFTLDNKMAETCRTCGLALTDPESIRLGIGPECRKAYSSISGRGFASARERDAWINASFRKGKQKQESAEQEQELERPMVARRARKVTVLVQCWECGKACYRKGRDPERLRCLDCSGELELLQTVED